MTRRKKTGSVALVPAPFLKYPKGIRDVAEWYVSTSSRRDYFHQIGTQTSAFCSVKTFRELYLPYYKKLNGWIRRNTAWNTFKHSCGSVERFIPSFIESGFDILNPVQCSATGMDADHLKTTYGSRITFWGGGIDAQQVLPFGTPEEVRRQVLERCRIFSQNDGYVFHTIHNVQARTPVKNIVAMLDAVNEFNGSRATV